MDRTLVIDAQLAIPRGHRLEVWERVDARAGGSTVTSVVDLDSGVRYRRTEDPGGEVVRWRGRVLDCTVMIDGAVPRTALVLDIDGDGPGALGARAALHGADAAVDAAKAEADRWGGGDRVPDPEPERFW